MVLIAYTRERKSAWRSGFGCRVFHESGMKRSPPNIEGCSQGFGEKAFHVWSWSPSCRHLEAQNSMPNPQLMGHHDQPASEPPSGHLSPGETSTQISDELPFYVDNKYQNISRPHVFLKWEEETPFSMLYIPRTKLRKELQLLFICTKLWWKFKDF